MTYGLGIPETDEAKKSACACQQFVWEYIYNNITQEYGVTDRNSWNSSYMNNDIYLDWVNNAESLYNQYHNRVSFDGQTVNVDEGKEITVTDTNGVLAHFETFTQDVYGIIFNHQQGSNDLKITANSAVEIANYNSAFYGVNQLMPNGDKYSEDTMGNYLYFEFPKGRIQNLIFSTYVDPVGFNINATVQAKPQGKGVIKKVNDMGDSIEGCTFGIYTDLSCTNQIGSGTTDTNGEIPLEGLEPGTYYIKELAAAQGYVLNDEVKTVEINAGQTSTV